MTLQQLVAKVKDANRSFLAGSVRDAGTVRNVTAGQTLTGVPDIGLLLISTRDGRPVYVKDVAAVVVSPNTAEHRVWNDARDAKGDWKRVPAASVALAKRAGANAVLVSEELSKRLEGLKSRLIPDVIQVTTTRDYGETANEKANELRFHLGLATISIVVLIAIAIGWREALVTLVVIPTTILLTLFAANLMGYTINRVSLFALIFSIGILVDDAIVVVENIARHWAMHDGRPRLQATIEAVAEVGNPTIVATLTVVAALLPMLFVSGLMGPYMAPIPANASAAMLFSFFVAMVLAPWLMLRLAPRGELVAHAAHAEGRLGRLYRRFATPVVSSKRMAWRFLLGVGVATLLSMMLFVTKSVTVKLLPFDNKSEIAAVVDLPEGASVEETERVLFAVADIARQMPELTSAQAYAGTPAPFNFNGLVRHYYLRERPELGELQVNLAAKGERRRTSHEIALDLRQWLRAVGVPQGTSIKVVEVPPGPPVLATLLAEIYGPDAATRRAVTRRSRRFSRTCLSSSISTIRSANRDRGCACRSTRTSLSSSASNSATCTTRSRYSSVALRSATPIGEKTATRSRLRSVYPRSCLGRGLGFDAGARQHAAREQDHRRARAGSEGDVRAGLATDLPSRWTLCRHGDGGVRRPVRGAALRDARGRQPHQYARSGYVAETSDQPPRPARG